ncbi:MAG: hypothetical protein ACPGSB_11530, partial [Opitutales bacterium]
MNFVSPVLWERAYAEKVKLEPGSFGFVLDILRPDGSGKRLELTSLPETSDFAELNIFRVERLV